MLSYFRALIERWAAHYALRNVRKLERSFEKAKSVDRYVAFVDLLGFGSRVQSSFEQTIDVYKYILVEGVILSEFSKDVNVRVYSDAFLLTSEDLAPLAGVVNYLHMSALRNGHLVRGGISFGKHFEASSGSNLYVVSAPLVKAVSLEKTIRHPCVVVDPEIRIPEDHWGPAEAPNFSRPLIFYQGQAIINPCNQLWGSSARAHVEEMLAEMPEHREKFDWFLKLHEAVFSSTALIPELNRSAVT